MIKTVNKTKQNKRKISEMKKKPLHTIEALNTKNKVFTLDFGKKRTTLYDGERVIGSTVEQILTLPQLLKSGSIIIVEDAHMGVPRTEKSLAQPYTKKELRKFYSDCEENGIELRFFPQQSSPRAAAYSNLKKDDDQDPIAIYNLCRDYPNISLKKPDSSFEYSLKAKEGLLRKRQLNKMLNFARRTDYLNSNDQNTQWINENANYIYNELSDVGRCVFGYFNEQARFKRPNKNRNIKKGDLNVRHIKVNFIYTILASMRGTLVSEGDEQFSVDDSVFLRKGTGRLPSWSFTQRYVFHMSPHHLKGGVARSNLYHHGAKKWIKERVLEEGYDIHKKKRGEMSKQEEKVFLKYRRLYSNAIKELYNIIKKQLENQHTNVYNNQKQNKLIAQPLCDSINEYQPSLI